VNDAGLFRGCTQLGDYLFFAFEDLVSRFEGVFVNAQLALRKIADVTDGSFDDVVAADEFVDRLRFRGRLDDDEVFGHCGTPNRTRRRRNSSRVHHARAYAGRRIDRARTIAPRHQEGQKCYWLWSL